MEQKLQVTSDTLHAYLTEHGVTIARLSEITGVSVPTINSCFLHHKMADGTPRRFTAKILEKLNAALVQMSADIRGCLLTFGSEKTFTNQRGKTYDPALVDAIKNGAGRYFNVNKLCENVLGWNKSKKHNILETVTGKAYGCISKEDADRINAELLSVAAVLSSYEVVEQNPDKDAINPNKQDDKPIKTKAINKGTPAPVRNEWDDTAVDLTERFRLFCQEWPDGILFFRVDFTYSHVPNYTVAYDHADFLAKSFPDIHPYRDLASGLVTAVMDEPTFTRIVSMLTANGQHYDVTPMYPEQ